MGIYTLNSSYDNRYRFKPLSYENRFYSINNPLDIHNWCATQTFLLSGGATGGGGSGFGGVAALNQCTITRDTTVVDSPYRGVPLRMDVSGNDPFISTTSNARWNIAPAANGQTWEMRVLAKASVSTQIELLIAGAASNGSWTVASGNVVQTTYNVTTAWQEFSLVYTFANATVANIQIRLDGPATGGAGRNIWFDGLQVYRVN